MNTPIDEPPPDGPKPLIEVNEEEELNRQIEKLEEALRIKQKRQHIAHLRTRLAEIPNTFDENIRFLDAMKKLGDLRQMKGQFFTRYYDKWQSEQALFPGAIDNKVGICLFLNSLLPDLRALILSKEFPEDWGSMLRQGQRAEEIIMWGDKHDPVEQSRTKRQRS